MRTLHLIGFKADGSSVLVIGPEVAVGLAIRQIGEMRTTKALPPGITRLEPYDSERGRLTPIFPAAVTPENKQSKKPTKH